MKCEDQRIKQKPSRVYIALARIYLAPSIFLARLLLVYPLCNIVIAIKGYRGIDKLIAMSKWN